MKVLITGGAGYLGTVLTEEILNRFPQNKVVHKQVLSKPVRSAKYSSQPKRSVASTENPFFCVTLCSAVNRDRRKRGFFCAVSLAITDSISAVCIRINDSTFSRLNNILYMLEVNCRSKLFVSGTGRKADNCS